MFYGWGEPVYICIMIFSILVDYANGWIIENNRHRPKVAKGALLCSLVANLGMLLFFKYYDFIVTNLTALFPGLDFLHPLGISLPIGSLFRDLPDHVLHHRRLPGQGYRSKTISWSASAAYRAPCSPKLIAGPIVRYKDVADGS